MHQGVLRDIEREKARAAQSASLAGFVSGSSNTDIVKDLLAQAGGGANGVDVCSLGSAGACPPVPGAAPPAMVCDGDVCTVEAKPKPKA